MAGTIDTLLSSPRFRSYAPSGALGADVNLSTDGDGTPCRAIRVGVSGDLVVTDGTGTDVTIYSLQIGETVNVQATAIKSAGTTAQKITVFW